MIATCWRTNESTRKIAIIIAKRPIIVLRSRRWSRVAVRRRREIMTKMLQTLAKVNSEPTEMPMIGFNRAGAGKMPKIAPGKYTAMAAPRGVEGRQRHGPVSGPFGHAGSRPRSRAEPCAG